MKTNQKSFFGAEGEISPVDHAMIGGVLTRRWQLPGDLVETIRCHHQPEEGSATVKMQTLVCLADTIVHHFAGDADYSLEALNGRFGQSIWRVVEAPVADSYEWYPLLSDAIGEACDLVLGEGHARRQSTLKLVDPPSDQ